MAKLKRILAGALALTMTASMLTACGDSDSSTTSTSGSTTSTGGSTTTSGSDDASAASTDYEYADVSTLTNTGAVYNIYCWNDEFKSRFETYYWPNRDESLWTTEDGTEITVNWVQNENTNNLYQTKLDEAIEGQNDAAADDKIDMFLCEADYALKYVEADITLDVRTEIGLTEDDMANQYQYVKDVMTNADGQLKGVSWQATPGAFMYNTVYAEEVLGTSDPEEVQAMISDWDGFEEVAAKMKEAGIAMVSGYDDTYRCFSNNVSAPWVDSDGNITIDPQIKEWVTQTKEYTDAGYNNGTSLWGDDWVAGQKIDGKTFGYFFSSWGIAFTLLGNTLETAVSDGGKEESGNGGYGLWKVCEGPQSYFWGGTWLCGAYGSDNVAITYDIMKKMTCDTEIMSQIVTGEQDYVNNKEAIQSMIDNGYSNPFLGGQNQYEILSEICDNIDASNKLSAYDQGCNEEFQAAMKEYFLGNKTYEEAIDSFKTAIATKYGTLNTDTITAD